MLQDSMNQKKGQHADDIGTLEIPRRQFSEGVRLEEGEVENAFLGWSKQVAIKP